MSMHISILDIVIMLLLLVQSESAVAEYLSGAGIIIRERYGTSGIPTAASRFPSAV